MSAGWTRTADPVHTKTGRLVRYGCMVRVVATDCPAKRKEIGETMNDYPVPDSYRQAHRARRLARS